MKKVILPLVIALSMSFGYNIYQHYSFNNAIVEKENEIKKQENEIKEHISARGDLVNEIIILKYKVEGLESNINELEKTIILKDKKITELKK